MKKYKEWLTNEIEIMESETSENYPHEQMVEREVVLNLINQLDELELPMIPNKVEEEQLFYVVDKYNTAILSKGIDGNPYPREGVFSDYFVGHEDYMLTEQEIKYYDPRYMTFAKPIEEFEE